MTGNSERSVTDLLKRNRFAFLLMGLVVLLFYGTVIEVVTPRFHAVAIRITVGMILSYLMVVAALVVGNINRSSRKVVLLAVAAIVFEIIDVALLRDDTQVLSHGFGALFIAYVVVRLLSIVFSSQRVTADTIFASICAYLLLATMWMYAYSLLELFEPGAFSYSLVEDPTKRIMRLGAEPAGVEFYYSLVTMTTLGYGDIVPTTPAARSLSTLQAVVGQLYLAVLVARLVGLHVATSAKGIG